MKTKYEDILRNKTDEEIWNWANGMAMEKMEEAMQNTVSEAGLNDFTQNCCKFVEKIARIPVLGKAAVNINLFCGMLVDSHKREYNISTAAKGTIMAALTYLALPVDMIPDAVPIMGMLDDACVLRIVAGKLANELSRYKEYLYRKNMTAFQKAVDVVFSERIFQTETEETENEETDSNVTFIRREEAVS